MKPDGYLYSFDSISRHCPAKQADEQIIKYGVPYYLSPTADQLRQAQVEVLREAADEVQINVHILGHTDAYKYLRRMADELENAK